MAHIEIYTTNYCPYCTKAKALLKTKGVSYQEYDVTMNPADRVKMTERSNGGRTVPQIFINNKHVGGCDDIHALDRAGKLDALIAA
jgi:glutaredoxin 3